VEANPVKKNEALDQVQVSARSAKEPVLVPRPADVDAFPGGGATRKAWPSEQNSSDSLRPENQPIDNNFHENYRLLGKLGKGAFAQVHVASRAGDLSERRVAVKVIELRKPRDGEKVADNGAALKAVLSAEKEAEIMRKTSHLPNCLKLMDHLIEGSVAYLVMEVCDLSLLDFLERRAKLEAQVFRSIFVQMFKGLAGIHAAEIAHRDIKPDNFLINLKSAGRDGKRPEPVLKICDFGLAQMLDKTGSTQGVYGTAPFMSPEMLSEDGEYGCKTDVWSAGVVMYTLLLGSFPYIPLEPNPKAMKIAIRHGTPKPAFKPKAGLIGSKEGMPVAITTSLPLLRQLLCRQPGLRMTAAEAVQHPWFNTCFLGDGDYNFLPMFHSARRMGAFDLRNLATDSATCNKPQSALDSYILLQQKMHHPKTACASIEPVKKDRTSTEVQVLSISSESTRTGSSVISPNRTSTISRGTTP